MRERKKERMVHEINTSVCSNNSNNGTTMNSSSSSKQSDIVLVAKFDYESKEANELSLKKNERLILIDNSKNWWLVKKVDSDQVG